MDREALELSLARRLLDHIEHRTTDLADDVMELPTDVYSGARHEREVEVLFRSGRWSCVFPARCRGRRRT